MLQFPELGELQKDVVAVHRRDDEAGGALPQSAAENVVPQKRQRRMEDELKKVCAAAALVHLPGGVAGVPIDRLEMVPDSAKGKVLKFPLEPSDGAPDGHPLVNVAPGPFGRSSIVES